MLQLLLPLPEMSPYAGREAPGAGFLGFSEAMEGLEDQEEKDVATVLKDKELGQEKESVIAGRKQEVEQETADSLIVGLEELCVSEVEETVRGFLTDQGSKEDVSVEDLKK